MISLDTSDELFEKKQQMDQLYAEMQTAAMDLKQLYANERRRTERRFEKFVRLAALSLVGTTVLLALGESFQNVLLIHGAAALAAMTCIVTWKAAEIFVNRVLLRGRKSDE